MLFRRKASAPLPPPPDPVIDAQIHWLAQRGLVVREEIGTETWIAACDDPADPMALAATVVAGEPCCRPDPLVTIDGTDPVSMVHALADGLELPIDEVEIDGTHLAIRAGSTRLSFDAQERSLPELLADVAGRFVDSAHVLLTNGPSFAIVHRDIAREAEVVMQGLPAL